MAWNWLRPLLGPIASSAVVFSAGDVIAQKYNFSRIKSGSIPSTRPGTVLKLQLADTSIIVQESGASLDLHRVFRATTFGVGISLWLRFWWGKLELWWGNVFPLGPSVTTKARMYNTAAKLITDQLIGASLLNGLYFFTTALMEDGSISNAVHRVRQCWYPQMQQHLQVWPFFNALNFYFVPLHNRVLVRNVAFVLWSALMSKHSHSIDRSEAGAEPPADNDIPTV